MSSSRMTHEEKDELVIQLRERIVELELRLGCCRDASTGKDLLIAALEKRLVELEARLENEKATAEEAEALSRFRAERATVKIVPTTVRTEWYGRMW